MDQRSELQIQQSMTDIFDHSAKAAKLLEEARKRMDEQEQDADSSDDSDSDSDLDSDDAGATGSDVNDDDNDDDEKEDAAKGSSSSSSSKRKRKAVVHTIESDSEDSGADSLDDEILDPEEQRRLDAIREQERLENIQQARIGRRARPIAGGHKRSRKESDVEILSDGDSEEEEEDLETWAKRRPKKQNSLDDFLNKEVILPPQANKSSSSSSSSSSHNSSSSSSSSSAVATSSTDASVTIKTRRSERDKKQKTFQYPVSKTFGGLHNLVAAWIGCSASSVKLTFDGETMGKNMTLAAEDIDPGDEVQFDMREQ